MKDPNTKPFPELSFASDPFVIHPFYTGRDKGALYEGDKLLTFFNEGYAWWWIFNKVQPSDMRACSNYRVIRLSEYLA
jgi:hypothetical protein